MPVILRPEVGKGKGKGKGTTTTRAVHLRGPLESRFVVVVKIGSIHD